jgi:hypothetical protein
MANPQFNPLRILKTQFTFCNYKNLRAREQNRFKHSRNRGSFTNVRTGQACLRFPSTGKLEHRLYDVTRRKPVATARIAQIVEFKTPARVCLQSTSWDPTDIILKLIRQLKP